MLGQAFSAWIHICAVRLFVESILRYGLPPKFLAALMKPNQKTAPKLRKLLASLFGSQGESPGCLQHRLSSHLSCLTTLPSQFSLSCSTLLAAHATAFFFQRGPGNGRVYLWHLRQT